MYTEYYGLRAQAFRLTPDPTYFFSSATHKSALAYMRYGIEQGEGFIVITGAPGTGKSTLALTLADGLPRNTVVLGELVTTQLQPEDLLRSIAAAFRLEVGGAKSDLIARLQGFFSARVRAGKRVLLLVDEAHDLPQVSFEELRMLSNLHQGRQALLQCILLGQPPLRNMLAETTMDQFQQRVLAAHLLTPLSLNETRGYILHRLQQAGWRGDPSFTANAIKLVHQYTQGVPRRINALCTRLMLHGFIEEKNQLDAATTTQVYNEWMQELGQTASVVPLRQPQLQELHVSGLTQENVMLGRAVGADAHPALDEPTMRGSTPATSLSTPSAQREVTTSLSISAVQPDNSITGVAEENVQATLSELTAIISQRSYPMMWEKPQRPAREAGPRFKLPRLLLIFILLIAVLAVAEYLTGNKIYHQFIADKITAPSQRQTAITPHKPDGDSAVAKPTRLPAEPLAGQNKLSR